MIDDPIVLILREAAARGWQLRLAHEQAARSETRSDGIVSEVLRSDQGVAMTMTPQRSVDAVDKESSA